MLPQYKEKLDEIKAAVSEIATGLCKANTKILEAMSECNEEEFMSAREFIRNVSSKTTDIDNNIVKTLALYSPEAKDLRLLVAYLKITNELVRASSNTRSYIKGFTKTCEQLDKQIINEYAIPMQRATVEALTHMVEMINNEDSDEVQELYSKVRASSNTRSYIKGFTKTCEQLDKQIINEYAIPMQRATVEALTHMVEMINNEDSDEVQELYSKVLIAESKSDDLYDMIESSILANEKQKEDFSTTNKMLSSLRKSEKIADRALSIASLLLYASIGGDIH